MGFLELESIKDKARAIADLPEQEFNNLVLKARSFSLAPAGTTMSCSESPSKKWGVHPSAGGGGAGDSDEEDEGVSSSRYSSLPGGGKSHTSSLYSSNTAKIREADAHRFDDDSGVCNSSKATNSIGSWSDQEASDYKGHRHFDDYPQVTIRSGPGLILDYDEAHEVMLDQSSQDVNSPRSDISDAREMETNRTSYNPCLEDDDDEEFQFSSRGRPMQDQDDFNTDGESDEDERNRRLYEKRGYTSLYKESEYSSGYSFKTMGLSSSSLRASDVDNSINFSCRKDGSSPYSRHLSCTAGSEKVKIEKNSYKMDQPPFGHGREQLHKVGNSVNRLISNVPSDREEKNMPEARKLMPLSSEDVNKKKSKKKKKKKKKKKNSGSKELDFKKELELEKKCQKIKHEHSQLEDEENLVTVVGGREIFKIEKKLPRHFEDRSNDIETHIDGELPPNAVVIANTNITNGDDKHLNVYRGQVIFLQENQFKCGKEELKAETNDSNGLININSIRELEMSCLRTAPNIITDDLLPHCLSGTFFIYLEENTAHFVYNKVGTVYHEKLELSGLSSDLEILGRVQSFILKNRSIFLFYIDDDSATYCNQFLNSNRHINKDGKLSPYIPDWYHGYAGEDHAKKVLADKQIGSFVVVKGRPLENYILLVTDGTLIHCIPIVEKGGHVAICNKSEQYYSVTDLVEHCLATPLFIETDDKPTEILLQGGVSRHEKDIPDGFSTLDPYWTELYMQTLSEGKEKQTSIRLMVVGHERIGKTTLSRNLMDKTGEEIISTDGIEVHIDTCTIGDCGMWKKTVAPNEDSEMFERIGKMMQSNTKSKQDSNTSATVIKNKTKNKQTHDLDEMKAIPKDTKYETDSNIQAETRAEISKGKMSDDMASRQTKEHQTVDDSTRETEIVLPIGNANKIIAHSKSIGNSADKTVSIWDFGGQYIYYATHQLFHSPRAVYLLVLDLSKDLDARVEVENPVGNIRESARDVQSFIKFWMNSIHTFVGSKSGEPPVILVGTHKDKIGKSSDEYSKNYFNEVRKLFDNTPLLLQHIQHKQFFLNNLTPDTIALDELRTTIMEIAERQSCFNQEYPARWVQLEYALKEYALKEVKRPHLKFSKVCEIDSKSEVPIAEIDKIRLFLMFHHFQGNLVYFNENELNEFVILNPQWLIDAFKSIITSGKFCKRFRLRRLWQDFGKTGILKKKLIKEAWEHNEDHEFFSDRDMILKFFVRLGIISRCRSYDGCGDDNADDDNDGCGGGDGDGDGSDGDDLYNYIVPSLLPVLQTEHTIKNLIENTKRTDLVLVFRFESSYISPTIYHRTTAAAMGRWAVVEYCDTRILYGNIGMYTLDVDHVGLTRLTDRTIELSVYNLNGNSVKGQVADCFRRFITKVIKHELNRFQSENISQFETVFRCACTSEDRFKYMTIQELKSLGRKRCLQSSPIHHIDGRNSLRQWYPDNVTLSKGNDGTVVDKPLDDRDIGELAKAVGKNWTILGASLGLSRSELDRIEMDRPSSALMQIWDMFKEWKKKVGSSATMKTLVDRMKANESFVTIDWDIVQDVLDRCESDDQKLN